MQYYFIDNLADDGEKFCFVISPPKGTGVKYYRMAEGIAIEDEYSDDVRMDLSDEHPGIKLGSLIGNTLSYLIVMTPVKELIEEYCEDIQIEYLPFTLYNHKGRVHSNDYFIVNPIGTIDCLNLNASEIKYFKRKNDPPPGKVLSVKKFVIDTKKLEHNPALFRIHEAPRKYVINKNLVKAFKEKGFTNMHYDEIEQQED